MIYLEKTFPVPVLRGNCLQEASLLYRCTMDKPDTLRTGRGETYESNRAYGQFRHLAVSDCVIVEIKEGETIQIWFSESYYSPPTKTCVCVVPNLNVSWDLF